MSQSNSLMDMITNMTNTMSIGQPGKDDNICESVIWDSKKEDFLEYKFYKLKGFEGYFDNKTGCIA